MNALTSRKNRWVRSNDGIFAGVCEGLGESFGVEPWALRLMWVLSFFFFGSGLFIYILMALALPTEDEVYRPDKKKLLGVCHQISLKSEVDLGLVRLAALGLLMASFGTASLIYLVLYFVLDEQEEEGELFY